MKIVIIEDRIGRLEKFTEFDIKKYETIKIITGIEFDNLLQSLEGKDTSVLDEFSCVASHRSALSNEIRDVIKNYCKAQKKPLIFFSGGITSSVFKDLPFPFLHINSKDFYSLNLRLFIDNYKKTQKINLLMLQFGVKWKLSLLLDLRNNIAVALNNQVLIKEKEGNENNNIDLIKRVSELNINSIIKQDLINENSDLNFLNNDFSKINEAQIQQVKSVINQLINKVV